MTQNTDEAWEAWAVQDPYYSVLTDPKFRAAEITVPAREEFFATGYAHVSHVLEICRQRLNPAFTPQRILDFGCGVGRLVIPFAGIAREVVGMDIAPSMLEKARRHCDERNLSNVILIPSDDALSSAAGLFDLVHTCIVLQHVEVARGRVLLQELVRRIQPGGCGAIHITFAWNIHATTYGQLPVAVTTLQDISLKAAVKRFLRNVLQSLRRTPSPPVAPTNADPEMQMNFYNLSELFFILHQAGIQRIHTEVTDHGGALGAFLFFRVEAGL
jgi:2-polyprenyl-3-methyl-5-hydroxy-6-metoxy-1,4-benzoquinol methylase